MKLMFLIIIVCSSLVTSYDIIQFNVGNTITLRGDIDKYMSPYVIDKLVELNHTLEINNDIYIYINSGGGDVSNGIDIINIIQTISTHRNITCVAHYAASMAFVIFQTCSNRYITSHATLMQHQTSVTINNIPLKQAISYLQYVSEREFLMDIIQADRIGMDVTDFSNKVMNEWYIYGSDNIKYNTADKIVYPVCSNELIKSTVKIYYTPYSGCPLILNPMVTTDNSNSELDLDENINSDSMFGFW